MLRVLLNCVFPFQPWKIFAADIKNIGVWSIVLYQDFLKVIPKAKMGSYSHGNMKQSALFWVTEPILNAASVAPHQLNNGTAPIMTWCLPSLRSVWAQSWVRSITKCITKLMLNFRYWDKPIHGYPTIISLQGPRGNPVFEYHEFQLKSVRVCQHLFYAHAVDTMPLRSYEPWSESYCKRLYS